MSEFHPRREPIGDFRSPSAAFGRIALLSSDRAGTRTQDQRINLPHRLSPTASRFEGSHHSYLECVDGLDSIIAVSGVPRRVSEAGADDPPVPCLLIAQSLILFWPSRSPLPVALWRRGLSGCSSKLRHSHLAVLFVPARGSYFAIQYHVRRCDPGVTC